MNFRLDIINMTLFNILKGLVIERKEIPLSELPSQGFFYPKDMRLFIKAAEFEDILEYEQRIDRTNIINSIECIKVIVIKNVSLNKNYNYNDLKSVDIIYIFLEIVRFTKKKELLVDYQNLKTGEKEHIPFCSQYFNYFDFSPFMKYYDSDTRQFVIDGFRFSFPSFGVENSLSRYLEQLEVDKLNKMKTISYDFLFFLKDKNNMSLEEIDNVIHIFNYDIEDKDKEIVNKIVSFFTPVLSYSLRIDGVKVDLKSSMKLESIWHV